MARKKSLLIGINYVGSAHALKGCKFSPKNTGIQDNGSNVILVIVLLEA